MVKITATYVGGPNDGTTEEIEAGPGPGDAPGIVRIFGFEVWPADASGPSGRYEPDTSEGGRSVPFIWQGYTPEERTSRKNDPALPFKVTQLTGMSRVINRVFFGTPISAWIVRRALHQQKTEAPPADGRQEPDQPTADGDEEPGR